MSRPKKPKEAHAVTRGVSLSPEQDKFIRKAAAAADLSISQLLRRYINSAMESSSAGCNRCNAQ